MDTRVAVISIIVENPEAIETLNHLLHEAGQFIIGRMGEILASAVVPTDQQLTRREKEILLLIRQGFLSKEIASKLNLSIYTVNNHRKNILAKLNVDNVIEAINRAESFGILY